jgi:hypothetical protein
VSSK